MISLAIPCPASEPRPRTLTSARPAVRPLTTTSVRMSSVLPDQSNRVRWGLFDRAETAENRGEERVSPLRVRQPLQAPTGPRVRVRCPLPTTLQPRRNPTDIGLVSARGKLGPKDVARRHADEDGGSRAREGLFGAKEAA